MGGSFDASSRRRQRGVLRLVHRVIPSVGVRGYPCASPRVNITVAAFGTVSGWRSLSDLSASSGSTVTRGRTNSAPGPAVGGLQRQPAAHRHSQLTCDVQTQASPRRCAHGERILAPVELTRRPQSARRPDSRSVVAHVDVHLGFRSLGAVSRGGVAHKFCIGVCPGGSTGIVHDGHGRSGPAPVARAARL